MNERTKRWAVLLGAGAGAFLCLQFVRPALANPPVTSDIEIPPQVKSVLQRACYDCHSNETHLAWFDRVSPAIWLVAKHVKEGRAVMNFSEWDHLNQGQQTGKLFESLNQMAFGTMPPSEYTMLHPAAKLSDQDLAVLRDYLATQAKPVAPDPAKASAAQQQYEHWIKAPPVRDPKPAPNGIGFMPDYKDWEAISTTDRVDNGTMRVILGNEIATNAIRENKTNPWPDGATFAKVAWDAAAEPDGTVHPGPFKQVEFMIKDGKKYEATEGWGWARWWKGTDLEPYGHDLSFTQECTNCHKPMEKDDFVFSTPFALRRSAALPSGAPFDSHGWRVITSSMQQGEGTMSTLYGNDLAVKRARGGQVPWPKGAELSLVTWKKEPDAHWFGANVPGAVQSVEQVTFSQDAAEGSAPRYAQYDGTGAKKGNIDSETAARRIAYIEGQHASVMP